jgi:histidinol-phosphate aminotransferase
VAGSSALALVRPATSLSRPIGDPSVLDDYTNRLCYNENPLGPSPLAMTALTEQVSMAHRYHDWWADTLRSDLGNLHGLSSSRVIAGCGATEILRLAALAFAEAGKNVVMAYPSYGQFGNDASFLGADVRYSDLDANHRVDLSDMASLVDANTTAVCLTNPNNPTATVLPATDIASFVAALPSSVVTIIDEAYHHYVQDPGYVSAEALIHAGERVVVIRTFSKVFGLAGARIGYAIGPSTEISAMSSWHIYATVSRLGLEAACAALDDAQHVADTVALNEQAKAYCFSEFDQMGLAYIPSETSFFMVDVGTSASYVAGELSARGIRVRTGWGMPQHLRVSTGTMEEMETFISELRDILGITAAGPLPAPRVTALGASYPNPFRRSTEISYALAAGGHVLLEIYNIHGQLVKTMIDGMRPAGRHELRWDGTNQHGARVASGSYFYRLRIGDYSETRRMILVR